jgi:hypothetical protein
MTKFVKPLAALSLLCAAAAASSALSPAEAGTTGAVTAAQLFPGQFEASVKGYRVFFAGSKSGRLTGVAYGQEDTGRWSAKGATLCVTWNDWTRGKPVCGKVVRKDGWYVAAGADGTVIRFRRADMASQ